MNTILFVVAIVMFFVAYQLIVKHNHKLICGYNFKSDKERYPKKVEEKMCAYIGFSIMLLGFFVLLLLFMGKSIIKEKNSANNILFATVFIIGVIAVGIRYRVKKDLGKYNQQNEGREDMF